MQERINPIRLMNTVGYVDTSKGVACSCEDDRSGWRVIDRECNYSRANKYQRTPSVYSTLICFKCGNVWRTKAGYVPAISDITQEELREVCISNYAALTAKSAELAVTRTAQNIGRMLLRGTRRKKPDTNHTP